MPMPPRPRVPPCLPKTRCKTTDDAKPWRYFTSTTKTKHSRATIGTDTKVHARTGYHPEQLDVAWDQVRRFLAPLRPHRGHDNTKAYFFLVFVYIHLMPTVLNTHVLVTPTTGSLSKSTFYRRLGPLIDLTAENLNLIRWANRLRRDNHVLHFPKVRYILFSTLHFSQS